MFCQLTAKLIEQAMADHSFCPVSAAIQTQCKTWRVVLFHKRRVKFHTPNGWVVECSVKFLGQFPQQLHAARTLTKVPPKPRRFFVDTEDCEFYRLEDTLEN